MNQVDPCAVIECAADAIVAFGTDRTVLPENAFKYSREGGQVTVRARARDGQVEVTVEDRGIGIADGDHERIFERFFQGGAGDRRRFGGIGLGLYIVRWLRTAGWTRHRGTAAGA